MKVILALIIAFFSFQTVSLAETTPVHVTGLNISQKNIGLYVGEKKQIEATVLPDNATNNSIKWQSDNPDVAIVDASGVITGMNEGLAVITAQTEDRGYTHKVNVRIGLKSEDIQWQTTFGGGGWDHLRFVEPTNDGGYIVGAQVNWGQGDIEGMHWPEEYHNDTYDGSSFSQPSFDEIWIVKLNKNKEIEWQRSLGGNGGDTLAYLDVTDDGGYFIAGTTWSTDGDLAGLHRNVSGENYPFGAWWGVKLDVNGDIIWSKVLSENSDNDNRLLFAEEDSDGGYWLAGNSSDTGTNGYWDVLLMKIDKHGNIEKKGFFGGSNQEELLTFKKTTDNGFIFGAGTLSNNSGDVGEHYPPFKLGNDDAWIVKVDKNLKIEWSQIVGGGNSDTIRDIVESDGGFYTVVNTFSNDGDMAGYHPSLEEDYKTQDIWLGKFSKNGDLLWSRTLGGSKDDFYGNLIETKDKGLILSATTLSSDGDLAFHEDCGSLVCYDMWVTELDKNGNDVWSKTYGSSNEYDRLSFFDSEPFFTTDYIQETSYGYLLMGETSSSDGDIEYTHQSEYGIPHSDIWLAGLDRNGEILFKRSLGGTEDETPSIIEIEKDGNILIGGLAKSMDGDILVNKGDYDIWLVSFIPPMQSYPEINQHDYLEWPMGKTNDTKKTWKITFSSPMNQLDVDKDNVFIVDQNQQKIPIDFNIGEDGTVLEVSSQQPYEIGQKYTLYIKDLQGVNGAILENNIKFSFDIE